MGKELRTSTVPLKLHRYPRIDGSHWGFKTSLQPFFPTLEKLFKTDTLAHLSEYGIRLSEEITSVVNANTIKTARGIAPVHRKTTMILSPFKWMRGDYGVFGVPKPADIAEEMQSRLQSPYNAGYVGALTSVLLSESGCPHFPKVYGVFTGITSDYTMDISDDYVDLAERPWFGDNLGKTFELRVRRNDAESEFVHTRRHRVSLELGGDALLENVEDIQADHVSNPAQSVSASQLDETSSSSFDADASSTSGGDDLFDIESCDCSDDEEDDDDSDDEEPFAWATFHDVPVITTVMEVCEGHFYDLVHQHSEPEKHVAWMAQVLFALAFAQRNYGLTHNDLHGNNVMYVATDQEYMYYKHAGVCYRVPTYGYLIKIIDFDRAITSVRLQGMKDARTFASSQFQPGEEAEGQYNIDPFYTREHPYIHPNPSFDLVRLATSLFWDMFPKGPNHAYSHPLFGVFIEWMTQVDGTSVMFRKQRDNHDRYHGFHLYKAIARYCRDSAVPRREIAKLTAYQVPTIPLGAPYTAIEM